MAQVYEACTGPSQAVARRVRVAVFCTSQKSLQLPQGCGSNPQGAHPQQATLPLVKAAAGGALPLRRHQALPAATLHGDDRWE